MSHVLLVEDDPLISKSLQISLGYQGFNVISLESIRESKIYIEKTPADIYLLDINLPDGLGFDLCEWIRSKHESVPIVLLTAKTDEASAVKGLTLGADDYIRKPFGVQELVVRMNRLLDKTFTKNSTLLIFGKLKLDPVKWQVWANDTELNLSKREFEILKLLIQKRGATTTRDEILNALNVDSQIFDRTIDSHLSHLRKKIREAGAGPISIIAVYGIGYRLEEK